MSDIYAPYCIYCDAGENADHGQCDVRWNNAQNGGSSGMLPVAPHPPKDEYPRRNPSFGWASMDGSDLPL